jgi:hypothetical protein
MVISPRQSWRATPLEREPPDSITSDVRDGWVTLRGVVDSRCESKKAERAVGAIAGIKGITNEIKVVWRSVIPSLAP